MTHSNGREREKRNVDFMDSSCVFSVLFLQSFRKSWKVERAAKKLLSRDLTVHELRIIDKHSNVVAVSVNVESYLSWTTTLLFSSPPSSLVFSLLHASAIFCAECSSVNELGKKKC